MDEKLIQRLESAVSRLESLSAGFQPSASPASTGDDAVRDPSVVAFADLIDQYVARFSRAAEVIGGQVLDVSKLVQEAFNVQKELLIELKQTQVRHCSIVFLRVARIVCFGVGLENLDVCVVCDNIVVSKK